MNRREILIGGAALTAVGPAKAGGHHGISLATDPPTPTLISVNSIGAWICDVFNSIRALPGDKYYISLDGVSLPGFSPYTLTINDIGMSEVSMGQPSLTPGTHTIKMQLVRASGASRISTITVTV